MNPRRILPWAPVLLLACQPGGRVTAPEDPSAVTTGDPAPVPDPSSSAPSAAEVELDGFKLGVPFAPLMDRAPYETPCDVDSIGGGIRTVVLFTGKPCRKTQFPETTTTFFFLSASADDGDDMEAMLARPIEAVGWIGGSYFNRRSNLPVEVGASAEQAVAALGPVRAEFQIGTEVEAVTDTPDPKPVGGPLLAHEHRNDLWSLTRSGLVVGFVAGPMPDDAESEQWRSIAGVFFRYAGEF